MTRLLSLSASTRLCIFLGLVLFVCETARTQMNTSHEEDEADPAESPRMQAPPPVSGGSYPTTFTSETTSNSWHLDLTMMGTYSNNIKLSEPAVSGPSYSIWPTIDFDRTTVRSHYALTYSPGFTIYRDSALNQANQNVSFALQYRLSPNITAGISESFNQTSNIFSQPNPLSTVSVSGSVPPPQQAVIPPTTNQIVNGTSGQIAYQCGENCLIGGSGYYGSLKFTNPTELPGLSNSSSWTASTFYARRFRERYYFGASYQFQDLSPYQHGTLNATSIHTQTQLVFGFLTVYLSPAFSISFSAGPQHFIATEAAFPTARSWTPMAMVSLGWQGSRTSLAASYARIINTGGGLNGAFLSNIAGISTRWQVNHTWSMGLAASYSAYQNLVPAFSSSSTNGHTFLGTVAVQRPLGAHISLQAGYNRTQQSYLGNANQLPSANQAFISLTYRFARPL